MLANSEVHDTGEVRMFGWKFKRGTMRAVLLTSTRAIKFPAFGSYRAFLEGLRANLEEQDQWCLLRHEKMCPVLWWLPLGFGVVMPRVRPLTEAEFHDFDYVGFADLGNSFSLAVECKADSFGVLDGKIVAVDYGGGWGA
ncbi:MAG: hypothetical protein AB7H97_08270 [Pseudobdellovibrionaceae bacterium]